MRQACWVGGLALYLLGCSPAAQERARDYNEDGVYLYQRGQYGAAHQTFEAALALKPGDAALLFNIGQCYDRQGDTAAAERFYQQCLQSSPNHAACRHALAVLLVRQGRRDEAARMIADWMAREPKRSAPYAEDGWLRHQAGDLPGAQARLQQALALDTRDTLALVELALVYEAMQHPDRAIVLYERALEHDPRQPEIVDRLTSLRQRGIERPRPE